MRIICLCQILYVPLRYNKNKRKTMYNPTTLPQKLAVKNNGFAVGTYHKSGGSWGATKITSNLFCVVGYDIKNRRIVLNRSGRWTIADKTRATNVAEFNNIQDAAKAMAQSTEQSKKTIAANTFVTTLGVGGYYITADRILGKRPLLNYGQTYTQIRFF